MRGKKVSKTTAIALIVGGDLVLLVLGWFMLVSPQRSTAQTTARAAQAAEVQLEQAQAPATRPAAAVQPKQPEIRTAYLYKLSKAMPMTTDMPNLLLELNQVVRSAGVELSSIAPSTTDPITGATPITLAVSGDFYSLTDLLYRLRSLVAVHNGGLDVSGRLFSITSVGLTPSGTSRALNATIALSAFTFGAPAAVASAAAAPAPTDTSGTSAGATTTTAETTSSASADTAIGH
jgi:Tfp pilus assembly protein PilO